MNRRCAGTNTTRTGTTAIVPAVTTAATTWVVAALDVEPTSGDLHRIEVAAHHVQGERVPEQVKSQFGR